MKYLGFLEKIKLAAYIVSTAVSVSIFSVNATSSTSTIAHPNDTGSYKDSFYFVDNGQKYLAVSDLTNGGISLLKAVNGSDTDYKFDKTVIAGNYWAPNVMPADTANTGNFTFITTHFVSNPLSDSYLEYFVYNVRTGVRSSVSPIAFQNYNGKGMIDATVWYESTQNNTIYLIGSRWQVGVNGSRLQWAKMATPSTFTFSEPVDLYDSPTGSSSSDRVDWNRTDIDKVVEAPIWSWWDHNSNGYHELYWSIGHSSPCESNVSAIRRGDINWTGSTPWIYVFNDDMTSSNLISCNYGFLTHPDFTATGKIRATSYNSGKFKIVNQPIW